MILEIAFIKTPTPLGDIPRTTITTPDIVVTEDQRLLQPTTSEKLDHCPVIEIEPKLSQPDNKAPKAELARTLKRPDKLVLVVTSNYHNAIQLCKHAIIDDHTQQGRLHVHLVEAGDRPFTITIVDDKILAFRIHGEDDISVHSDALPK